MGQMIVKLDHYEFSNQVGGQDFVIPSVEGDFEDEQFRSKVLTSLGCIDWENEGVTYEDYIKDKKVTVVSRKIIRIDCDDVNSIVITLIR